jgi:hypothetical protein
MTFWAGFVRTRTRASGSSSTILDRHRPTYPTVAIRSITSATSTRASIAGRSRAETTWEALRTNLNAYLKSFVASVKSHRTDLVLAGEARSPKLKEAARLFSALAYVDIGLVKTDLIAAENHFRTGHGKDASAS